MDFVDTESCQALSNDFLIAKIRVDTAENGPFKVRDRKAGVQVTNIFSGDEYEIRRNIENYL